MLTVSNELKIKLLGYGLTNTQIIVCEKLLIFSTVDEVAKSMFVSIKTTKHHLSEIYDKLSICGTRMNKHALLLYLFKEILHQQKHGYVKAEHLDPNRLPVGVAL